MLNRPAKITAYNYDGSVSGCEDFSMNVYWGGDYKSVFYLDATEGRSEFENIIETKTDISGKSVRTQNTSIQKHIISVLAISPLLPFLHSIDKCDVKQLEYLDTNDVYTITNIDIDDQGGTLDSVQLVYITFEDEPISKVSSVEYSDDDQKLAFWDNNDDGTADIDGEAEYDQPNDVFNSYQLYFESDGVTPAGSGDVIMLAYATSITGAESLIGIFQGQFGDSFSDSTKWQSTQSIWDYFNLSDTVAHRTGIGTVGRVQFDKRAFAEDNGYYSDEQEERAVDIRFELGIDGSDREPTTLARVYTIWGAFHRADVKNSVTDEYGVTIVGKVDQKNTLNNIQDVRVPLPSGANTLVSAAQLDSFNNYQNTYILDVSPNNENYFEGGFVTKGGYSGVNSRGAYQSCNFAFGLDTNYAVAQVENVLNFTTGVTPYTFTYRWEWQRVTSCGAFSNLGDIGMAGDVKVYLDGVLFATLGAIAPATVSSYGVLPMTLSDTLVHTVLLYAPLTTGFEIKTEFEVQLKSLF